MGGGRLSWVSVTGVFPVLATNSPTLSLKWGAVPPDLPGNRLEQGVVRPPRFHDTHCGPVIHICKAILAGPSAGPEAHCCEEVKGLQGGDAEGAVGYAWAVGSDVTHIGRYTPPPPPVRQESTAISRSMVASLITALPLKAGKNWMNQAKSSRAPCVSQTIPLLAASDRRHLRRLMNRSAPGEQIDT